MHIATLAWMTLPSWLATASAQAADPVFDKMQIEMAPTGGCWAAGLISTPSP